MSSSRNALRIATRSSRLAIRQTEIVIDLLRAANPDLEVEIFKVTTTGDRDKRAYAEIGGKGLFVREVEEALVEGAADMAVHSAKDLTSGLAAGCVIAAVPTRAATHDVVVGGGEGDGPTRLGSLPPGSRVGTSSMRRRALVAEARPDLDIVELRGNLDTRLDKVERGDVDVAILAAAGIERLGHDLDRFGRLHPDVWTPAPGQGALAVEVVENRSAILDLVAPIDDATARSEVTLERAFSATLEGGCTIPLGCLAHNEGDRLVATAYLAGIDGTNVLRDRISGPVSDAADLGVELGRAILSCGGDALLEELRDEDTTEPAAP